MKKFFMILMGLILVLGFTACGGPKEEKKEITVYTAWEDDELPGFIMEYEKTHPKVKLNIIRDSTGVIAAKLIAEKENPQADIIWGVAASGVLGVEDTLEGYTPKGLENIEKKFYDGENKNPKWIGVTVYMNVISINTIEAKKNNMELPKSYADLLNLSYKGEIVMPNPASSGTGFFTVSGWLQTMGEEKGWAYMDKLNKNMKMYVHSGSAPTKMAAQGETIIGLGMGYRSLQMQNDGSPLVTNFPVEKSGWDTEVVAMVKKENINSEAKEFMNWAISKGAMDLYAKKRGIVSYKGMKSNLEGYPKDLVGQLAPIDIPWMAKNRDRILKEWENRYGKK